MDINNKITFFYRLEKKLWKDETDANRYFATLSILVAAIAGALLGGKSVLEDYFRWISNVSILGFLGASIILYGMNIAESIIATTSAKIATLRSLLILVCMACAYVVGVIASVVIMIIVAIIAFILFLMFMLTLLFGTGKSTYKNVWTGEKYVKEDNGLLGGETWRKKHWWE